MDWGLLDQCDCRELRCGGVEVYLFSELQSTYTFETFTNRYFVGFAFFVWIGLKCHEQELTDTSVSLLLIQVSLLCNKILELFIFSVRKKEEKWDATCTN